MKAHATVDVGADAVHWRDAPPVVLRRTGAERLHLCQAAGGPLGGDELALDVTVAAGRTLHLRSAAATVVQPGPFADPAHWRMCARVGGEGDFRFAPEQTVLCAGSDYRSELSVRAEPGATVTVREEVVLGRHGERGGRYRGRITLYLDGVPVLRQENQLDGADRVLSGPAGTAGYRVFGTLLLAGHGLGGVTEQAHREGGLAWSLSPLDGPAAVVTALGDSAAAVAALLSRCESALNRPGAACLTDDHTEPDHQSARHGDRPEDRAADRRHGHGKLEPPGFMPPS